ncbi:MAG: hypothetical protein GY865_08970, partial [candidate division Zixibacteria bacterium]|nr:hypothetical protein [candidate division Zixibacteria bacterium]
MKYYSVISVLFLVCLILTILGCGQQSTSPVVTEAEPVGQEIPADIERIIELNSFDGLNNQKGMALSMPIDIINGDTDGEWDVYSV